MTYKIYKNNFIINNLVIMFSFSLTYKMLKKNNDRILCLNRDVINN